MLALLLLLLPIGSVSGGGSIDWTFWMNNREDFLLNATIGTPATPVALALIQGTEFDGLRVVADRDYDNTKSSSFEQLGYVYDENKQKIGLNGTESFTIGDAGIEVRQQPFAVIFDWRYEINGSLGLNRPADGAPTFIQSVLKQLDEQVVTMSYDNASHDFPLNDAGVVTLGGRAPGRCGGDWIEVPEAKWTDEDNQWTLNVDDFSFAQYSFDAPGLAYIEISGPFFTLPTAYRPSVLKALGATDEGSVPCDQTVEFAFTFGQRNITITPAEYLDRTDEKAEATCSLYMSFYDFDDVQFAIPATIFNRYCLLFNYATPGLGFADRLNQ